MINAEDSLMTYKILNKNKKYIKININNNENRQIGYEMGKQELFRSVKALQITQ